MPNLAMTDPLEKALQYYDEHYEQAASYIIDGSRKFRIGNREKRVCRYCRRQEPEVTFKTIAHALPEAIGNASIVVFDECDECNGFFGRTIENDFGKWSIAARALYQINGKSGVPTLKREAQGWRVELDKSGLLFRQQEGGEIVTFNEKTSQIAIKVPRDPYVPIGVFKTYVKMAVAISPVKAIRNFLWTADWLRETTHTVPFSNDIARLYKTFVPGPRPFPGLAAFLFLRKSQDVAVPYCTFVVAFGNEVHQIFLPCPEPDRVLQGKPVSLVQYPTPYHLYPSEHGTAKVSTEDLSCTSIMKDHMFELHMHAIFGNGGDANT